jgi:hypothetical protein
MSRRPTPFDLVFAELADARFPEIRAGVERERIDARDRDAFLMLREAVTLIHELRPEEAVGEQIEQLAALVQHAYLHWHAGRPTARLDLAATESLLAAAASDGGGAADTAASDGLYAQLAERRCWARVVPEEPHEPLDGVFVHRAPDGTLRVLAVLGLHPARLGFTVAEAAGPTPRGATLLRPDGSPLFAPAMEGGAAAGLHSVTGGEELLELGRRASLLPVDPPDPGARP